MNIVLLDAKTIGNDLNLSVFNAIGETAIYPMTNEEDVSDNIADAEVVVVNKIKLNEANLKNALNLKLICVTATGFDNIDIEYCKANNIAVCNVVGYSSNSVTQVTLTIALSLYTKIETYKRYVNDGLYTKNKVQNCLEPVFHEIHGKVWGIVGLGNIGKQVAKCAEALGCEVIAYNRTIDDSFKCVDIDTLCKTADIISIHLPLNDETKNLISKEKISLMKNDAIIINVARGLVADENALVDAIESGRLGGLGVDVYGVEPFDENHAYNRILGMDNVYLTPHMAWGAYEARKRCVDEICENIKAFYNDEKRNRIC